MLSLVQQPMNIAIFSKTIPEESLFYIQSIIDELQSKNCGILFYGPFYEKVKAQIRIPEGTGFFKTHEELEGKADFLFSIGGDGTLLDTISLVRESGIPILGINLGRMGFLSSIARDRIIPAIHALMDKKFKLDKRTLLRLETGEHLFSEMNYAMNELSVYRKSPQSMLKIEAYVDDEFLNSYWADGLIVSTPTGSTAYSLSNGGPIILPGSQNFVITPIATHNLTVRPIVIPDSSQIRIKVVGRVKEFYVNLDSRSVLVDSTMELMINREDFKINLVRLEEDSYFKTIRDKLLWGLDIRN